ncbi:MAG: hypothetical protein RL331_1536 [Bacteroidota bacterium]|jgi:uncharacterized membrane protein YgdD (TMEM256/DUF423 family)
MEKQTTFLAGLMIMLSIVFGAFGAHALKEILAPAQLATFEVGVRYQGFLSMGVLFLSLSSQRFAFPMKGILWAMLIGMFLFCFSIYGLVLGRHFIDPKAFGFLGPITPIGGAISIISWCVFLFRQLKYGQQ